MSATKRPVHPIADLFPMMTDEELVNLAADIKANGLIQPIVVDKDGVLIDGRNRDRACEIAGIEPETVLYEGDDPRAYIIASNISRRHLTKGQQAMAVAMVYPVPEKGGRGKKKTLDETSTLFGPKRLQLARTVLAHSPDFAQAVLAGFKSLDGAYAEARRAKQPPDAQVVGNVRRKVARSKKVAVLPEIDALAKLPAPEQRSLAEAARRGEKVSAITVLSVCDFEARKTSLGTGKAPYKPNRRNKANQPPTLDPQVWSMSTAQQRQAFVAAVGRSEIEDAIANEFHRAAAPKAEITETIEGTSHDGSAETDALANLPEAEKQSFEATKGGEKGSAVTAHNASASETGAVPEVIPDREQPQADDRDIAAAEPHARWLSRYEAIKARQAALGQELEALYRPFQAMMVELLYRIEDVDEEARRVNDLKPAALHGDGRLLGYTESVARAPGGLSIVKDLKLPSWEGDSIPAWPPQQLLPLEIAASMGSQSAAEELNNAIAREASRRKAAEARAAEEKLRRGIEGRCGG